MELKSSAFEAGGMIPKPYTCDGQDASPPLSWSDVPNGAKSLALIADDPDAPMGTWVHWVAWNIPTTVGVLEAHVAKRDSLPNGMKRGTSDFRSIGYGALSPFWYSPVFLQIVCPRYNRHAATEHDEEGFGESDAGAHSSTG
jgi:phosphatidylethanolamine-binding protein (PEBP) family uncharacterized protein